MKASRLLAAFIFLYCPCALYMIFSAPNVPNFALITFGTMLLVVMFFAGKIVVSKD
jgi:hypothetical protein